jgi:hypothetical protein
MAKAIELVETRGGCAILETHSRFDVLLHGKKIGQLYFNMTGYTGVYLPQPNGSSLDLGERGISAYRKAVAQLNREWAEAEGSRPGNETH